MAKAPALKKPDGVVWSNADWSVVRGHLTRPRGRPEGAKPLFRIVAEKLPFAALDDVEASLRDNGIKVSGIYVAHDSMGAPRYVGRGNVIGRLRSIQRTHRFELLYFSFYVVEEKVHEREIETLLIRGASHLLEFNDRKKRVGIYPGSIYDYEPGTKYYERQDKRGRKARQE